MTEGPVYRPKITSGIDLDRFRGDPSTCYDVNSIFQFFVKKKTCVFACFCMFFSISCSWLHPKKKKVGFFFFLTWDFWKNPRNREKWHIIAVWPPNLSDFGRFWVILDLKGSTLKKWAILVDFEWFWRSKTNQKTVKIAHFFDNFIFYYF